VLHFSPGTNVTFTSDEGQEPADVGQGSKLKMSFLR